MVKLIHRTDKAEKLIAYCARVSSPKQENPDYEKLLTYCLKNNHVSIFEMATMCVEITTSRAISAQILRHKSFSFQEFSQRYAEVPDFQFYDARRQDTKNRQNSIDDLPQETNDWFIEAQTKVVELSHTLYHEALTKGIAKESARFLLPLSTETKLYMHGNLRSWLMYCSVRMDKSTQLEHREIAVRCWEIFKQEFPVIAKAAEEHLANLKNV
jgi:thymidylate synthase (FAD)